ncbi:growth hormone-inducible transmembrane protein-like [Uloborus diversus]|uniref:growth hormone-inducible transmembrane protein-like n=1 Tax=Uloborus diversus TaxID=327109 RepID=UPI00240A921E|nr:growth hormone-inducible transmembrane protein-like [Uloborus diversus]
MAAALFALRTPCLSQATDAFLKSNILLVRTPMVAQSKLLASNARGAFRRANIAVRKPTLKERLFAPEQGTAFNLGKSFLLGASALGIGSLCYYGIGLSSEPGAIDKSMIWPKHVKDRIKSTYTYFGGSILITAASAFAVSQSPKLLSLMMRNSWLAIGATFAAMIGSGMIVRSIPYSEGIGTKQLAWVVHSGVMGAVVAPLCLLGGPLIMRAACYTAGIVGGLSAVAACAPSEKFLYMGGPLACGLGVVFASSLGSMFFPPTTALGAGLYSISMYGGLVLFGAFLLYDTQRIVRKAETYPTYAIHPYDPINASISIYLDTLNIFIRIAMLLAGGGSSRRK